MSTLVIAHLTFREAARRKILLAALLLGLVFSPFTSLSVPSPLMIFYAVLYLLVAIVMAVHQFNRRDL